MIPFRHSSFSFFPASKNVIISRGCADVCIDHTPAIVVQIYTDGEWAVGCMNESNHISFVTVTE